MVGGDEEVVSAETSRQQRKKVDFPKLNLTEMFLSRCSVDGALRPNGTFFTTYSHMFTPSAFIRLTSTEAEQKLSGNLQDVGRRCVVRVRVRVRYSGTSAVKYLFYTCTVLLYYTVIA